MIAARMKQLTTAIQPLRDKVIDHRVYSLVNSAAALRTFMEFHIFAVWDFMSLLKALQRALTCVKVPWVPSGAPFVRRLINEIVLAEESDSDAHGGYISHFELYYDAMLQAGADCSTVDAFLDRIRQEDTIQGALRESGVCPVVQQFVLSTCHILDSNSTAAIAAAFTLGRESLIPSMFRSVVANCCIPDGCEFDLFSYYLERHIDLDEESHAPMAARMLTEICGDDELLWNDALSAARESLSARLALWEGIARTLSTRSTPMNRGPCFDNTRSSVCFP